MDIYRRHSTEIEAYQFLYPNQIPKGVTIPTAKIMEIGSEDDAKPYVITIHGQKTFVVSGDWIATEPDGIHHYPIKPDIFAKLYYKPEEKLDLQDGAILGAIRSLMMRDAPLIYFKVKTILDNANPKAFGLLSKEEKEMALVGAALSYQLMTNDNFLKDSSRELCSEPIDAEKAEIANSFIATLEQYAPKINEVRELMASDANYYGGGWQGKIADFRKANEHCSTKLQAVLEMISCERSEGVILILLACLSDEDIKEFKDWVAAGDFSIKEKV